MPYQTQHILYVFHGALPGGEIWNCGLRTVTAVVNLEQLAELTDQVAQAFHDRLWTGTPTLRTFNSPDTTFVNVTGYLVPPTGPATLVTEQSPAQPGTGFASAQTTPNQTAIVASLRTQRAGRANRGRIYLPATAAPIVSGGRLDSTACFDLAHAVALLLTDISTTITADAGAVGPFPIAIQSSVETGQPAVVTLVQVGNVADTQRRRRDKLIEVYSIDSVPTS